ncbi:MAG: murein L,D-transpeptidase [Hyphomicrobiales bacterium]|nr:MAG: murein L,D-transpeptidase [Hyphomicrobiales bacterium]
MRFFQFLVLLLLVTLPIASVLAQDVSSAPLTADEVNAADLQTIPAQVLPPPAVDEETGSDAAVPPPAVPDPAIVKLQILLDRAGASPGVIDGFDGDNVRKAVWAVEIMRGLPADGLIDAELIAALDTKEPVVGTYTITGEDAAAIGAPIPEDYAEKAQRDFLGYASVVELLAERFHMDEDLLTALNPGAQFVAGEAVAVAAYGPDMTGKVARLEADKSARQLRAYDAEDRLIAAYPATIGSEDNPSPSGTHLVAAVAPMPNYTYNPDINFQQGENDQKLIIPPGPNGPVGSMWIDLTEPTFGIHGTPDPEKIDKTASHGCVRLTNWDAEELSKMVEPGVPVVFLD